MNSESYPYQRIFERDGFTCRYCDWTGRENFDHWFVANFCIDHVKPIFSGGSNEDSNLVLSCHACNLYKGSTNCASFEDAKRVVKKKRDEAEAWYHVHVRPHFKDVGA